MHDSILLIPLDVVFKALTYSIARQESNESLLLGLVDLGATLESFLVLHKVDILCELIETLAELTLLHRMHRVVSNYYTFVHQVGEVRLRCQEDVL